jgi:dienelactone hydrolase
MAWIWFITAGTRPVFLDRPATVRYGAGHGFFHYHTPMYRPEQAMEGWAKASGSFGQHLRG